MFRVEESAMKFEGTGSPKMFVKYLYIYQVTRFHGREDNNLLTSIEVYRII
jgi:hypothetical protein